MLPSVVWIALDNAVWPWDQAWYGEVSFDLWATLQDAQRAWPDAMVSAFGSKAPGIAWLGQFFLPLGRIIGDQRALLASVVVCQIGALAMMFGICRRLGGGVLVAFAGTLVLGASPLFVWATHEYLTEPLQTLTVVWSLLLLTLAGRTANPLAIGAQLPGVVAVALLAKLSSPLYIALPIAATAALLIPGILQGSHRRSAWLRAPTAVAAAAGSTVAMVGAGGWYIVNIDETFAHARLARADTGLYGTERRLGAELSEWTARLADSTFLPAVSVGMGLVVLIALGWKLLRGSRVRLNRRLVVAGVCLAEACLVLIAFATQPNEEARFLLPAVPFVAVLIAIAVAGAPRVLLAIAVALLSVELLFVTLQGFGVAPVDRLTYYRLGAPQRDPALRTELEQLVDLTCTARSAGRITIVAAEHPWFNANTLAMIASGRNSRVERKCYYTSLGYAESDAARAWERIRALDPPYILAIDYGTVGNQLLPAIRVEAGRIDPFNRVNRAVIRRVRKAEAFDVLPGSRAHGFVIFEQVEEIG